MPLTFTIDLKPALRLMTDEQLTYMASAPYAKVVDYIGHRDNVTLILATALGRTRLDPQGLTTQDEDTNDFNTDGD